MIGLVGTGRRRPCHAKACAREHGLQDAAAPPPHRLVDGVLHDVSGGFFDLLFLYIAFFSVNMQQ
jgi:hypothetical protein